MSDPEGGAFRDGNQDDLNEAERLLVGGGDSGGVVDLAGGSVRGAVVAFAACGRGRDRNGHGGVRGNGLTIVNGVISGGLNIAGRSLVNPLVIEKTRIESDGRGCGVQMSDARLKRLALQDCVVDGAIIADRIRVDNDCLVLNCDVNGAVVFANGAVGGTLSFEETQFGDGGRGLAGDGLSVGGAFEMIRCKAKGSVSLARARLDGGLCINEADVAGHGAEFGLDLRGAHFGGDLLLEKVQIDGALGIAHCEIGGRLVADGASVVSGREVGIAGDGVNVAHGISACFANVRGAVNLRCAQISKGLSLRGIEISGGETAIDAGGIELGGNWDLSRAKLVGDLLLAGGRIDGQLRLTAARLFGTDVAVRADGSQIGGGCFMSHAVVIGLLRFPATVIGNQFRLRGASLKVDYGPALLASGSVFARDVELNGGMVSVGALVFDQTEIRGTLDLSDSQTSSCAVARAASAVAVPEKTDGGVDARLGFDETVFSLVDAQINRIVMPGREDHRPQGVVVLSRARVGAYLDYSAAWPPDHRSRARSVDGRDIDHLVLDGFTYEQMSNPSGAVSVAGVHSRAEDRVGKRRMVWLSGQEACDIRDHFKPQPWVQLGQRLAAQGYHDDARTLSITRQRLALSAHSTSVAQRWQGRILDTFALFGHNPWRTLVWMAFFVVVFAGLWGWAAGACQREGCFDERVFVVSNRDAYTPEKSGADGTAVLDGQGQGSGTTYPPFHALGYSFDVFVPFISFGYADHWRPNLEWGPIAKFRLPELMQKSARIEGGGSSGEDVASDGSGEAQGMVIHITQGGVLYVLVIIEMLIGLALTSLAITGFAGMLRSD